MTKPSHRMSDIVQGPAGRTATSRQARISRSPAASGDKSRGESTGPKQTLALGPLGDRLGYILRRAQIAIFEDFIAAFERYDIRPAQYSMLTIIEQNPGLTQTQVAEALGIKKTNFVAIVDAFEKRGLVRRDATPGDRRSHALFLTEEGKALLRKLHRVAERHESRIVARVGPLMHKRMFQALSAIATMSAATGREN